MSKKRSVPLPTPPAALARVIQIAGDKSRPLSDLGRVCSQDPGLTVELLRVANSARYGFVDPVRSVPEAVVKLGAHAVRAYAITYSMRAVASTQTSGGLDANLFWEDSLRRAATTHYLAELLGYEDPFEAFAVGLCQDLGSQLLAIRLPHLAMALQGLRDKPGKQRAEAERVLAGRSHAEEFAVSQIAALLPVDIAKAVELHHEPPAGKERLARLARLGHAADIIADVVQAQPKAYVIGEAEAVLEGLSIKEPLSQIIDEVAARMIELAGDMEMTIGEQPNLDQLLNQAQVAMLNLAEEQEMEATALTQALREKEESNRQLEESNRKLEQMASTDPLTNLDNRRVFNRALEAEVERGKYVAQPFSVLIMDIDFFKRVNDTYGHPAGDAALQAISGRFGVATRSIDRVARLGGEEFGILLPGTGRTGGRVAAERIRAAVEAAPIDARGTRINMTISIGGATFDAKDPVANGDELVAQADKALYEAKRTGRNRVCWHTTR